MRPLNEIIIHCTDTPAHWWESKSAREKVAEVRRWHVKERGWSDIGYHFLVDRDGTVVTGRPLEKVGAHVKGHNLGTIGISLFGGYGGAATDAFDDHFTLDQEEALRKLIAKLKKDHPTITKVSGHNQYASKACPCFSVPNWIVGDGKARANPLVQSQDRQSAAQSRTVQASVLQIASGVGTGVGAFAALDGMAQIIALVGCFVVVALAMVILRERLKHWARGVR
jgi:N-acetylmuramoyl-L-alanine amidase